MNFYALTNTTDSAGSMWTYILLWAVVIGGMYFFLMRPQSKKKKKEEKMRSNVQIGDEITTIGGIMGRVVGIKEDSASLVIETGTDRAKLRIKRWAIGSVDTIHDDAE
ncbi:MAG: preprotein translocase subunit YajC [Clostridiales bacterium]|nr:preprotein translocase subunit YajC [Clostridiales bacterium]